MARRARGTAAEQNALGLTPDPAPRHQPPARAAAPARRNAALAEPVLSLNMGNHILPQPSPLYYGMRGSVCVTSDWRVLRLRSDAGAEADLRSLRLLDRPTTHIEEYCTLLAVD